MLVPNKHASTDTYRYGFNGMEKDDEIKGGEGNSLDFGARMLDPRAGRWFSKDNIVKPWLSPYQFASGNPVNHIDPDGNDEIHFSYYISQFLDKDGKAQYQLTLSSEIIENNKEHTFFMHSPDGEVVQFHPFKSDKTPSSTKEAYKAGLPLSKGINFLGFFENGVDDNAYLGTILQAAPEVMEHYSDVREDEMRFRGAINRASSVDFAEKLLRAEEVVYGIVDGYYLVKGLSKFAVKELGKASLQIAKPSFTTILGNTVNTVTKNKNANEAVSHFVLYEVFDSKTKEILKVGKANADDLMADGVIRRAHTSARLARKLGYTNASFRIVEDLGTTTTEAAKGLEAARVVKLKKEGNALPLNKETGKAYQLTID